MDGVLGALLCWRGPHKRRPHEIWNLFLRRKKMLFDVKVKRINMLYLRHFVGSSLLPNPLSAPSRASGTQGRFELDENLIQQKRRFSLNAQKYDYPH
jgi:hypothetical protein